MAIHRADGLLLAGADGLANLVSGFGRGDPPGDQLSPTINHSRQRVIGVPIVLLLACVTAQFGRAAASIDVRRFGASGDGSTDDKNEIQAAIQACSPGDTVVFSGGSYFVSDTVYLKSNCDYIGRDGASIIGYSGDGPGGYPLFRNDDPAGGNTMISGLTFTGGGIFFPDSGGTMSNVHITGCTFQNILTSRTGFGPIQDAIFSGGDVLLSNSTIDYNTFRNFGGRTELTTMFNNSVKGAIAIYSLSNLTISNNTFDLIAGNGISLPYGSSRAHPGLKILNNKFTRIHRMPIEIQMWYLSNTVISGNSISLPYYPYSFGLSFAAGGGAADDDTNATGTLIQNNVIDYTQTAGGNTNAWATCIELGGTGTVLDHNTCMNGPGSQRNGLWGGAVVVAGLDARISNNTFCGTWKFGAITYEPPHPEKNGHPAIVTNNSMPPTCSGVGSSPKPALAYSHGGNFTHDQAERPTLYLDECWGRDTRGIVFVPKTVPIEVTVDSRNLQDECEGVLSKTKCGGLPVLPAQARRAAP